MSPVRRALIALSAALITGPAFAQAAPAERPDEVFSRPVDARTRVAMNDSFGRLAEKAVVSGTFVQTKRIKRLGRDLSSKGDFIFSAKDGVYWKVLAPFPSTVIMTPTRLVQRSPEGATSVLDSKDSAVFKRIADTMQAVFSGSTAALEAEFAVYFQGDASSWRLGLIPKEKAVRDIAASILVEGGDSIRSMRLVEATGDAVTYSFTTTRRADGLEASERGLFVF
jgi:hypothetical protein